MFQPQRELLNATILNMSLDAPTGEKDSSIG
jgi:hypothetical protein